MCVCVGKRAGDRTIQQKAEQAETSRNGTGREGKEKGGGCTGWYATKRYSTDITERKGTTGQCWVLDRRQVMAAACWQRRNGELRKNPETDRDAAANHEFHFKLWHAVMYYCGNYKYVWYKWYSAKCREMGEYIFMYIVYDIYIWKDAGKCGRMRLICWLN